MEELKSKVTALPSEKNICCFLTTVCLTYISHLVKPYESFLTLVFNIYDITEYHFTVRLRLKSHFSYSITCLLSSSFLKLIFYPFPFIL